MTTEEDVKKQAIVILDSMSKTQPTHQMKGSSRSRPISAAINQKMNKGYYKQIEL